MPKRKHDARSRRVNFSLRNLPILDSFRATLAKYRDAPVSASEALDELLDYFNKMRTGRALVIERERLPELIREIEQHPERYPDVQLGPALRRDAVLEREMNEEVTRRTVRYLQQFAPFIHAIGREGLSAPVIVVNPESLDIGLLPADAVPSDAVVQFPREAPDAEDVIASPMPRRDQ